MYEMENMYTPLPVSQPLPADLTQKFFTLLQLSQLADVLYFAMVRAVKGGVSIDDAVKVLDERSKKVTRRPGNDKKERIEAAKKILEGGK